MSEKAAMGVVFGIMVGLVICVGLFKFANKDNKIKSQYDERQEKYRKSDFIADAFSGVETDEPQAVRPMQPSDDIAKLKMYTLLRGVVIVLEITGIALLAIL